ncbi:MAG TPA: hypothetical protein VFR10_09845, partial [bacterium]|nr:hypothetical protein [bacterium]
MTRGVIAAGVFFLAAHATAALSGGQWWGLHFARYLDAGRILLCLGVGGLAARGVWSAGRDASEIPSRMQWLLPLAAFAAFWLLRDRMHFLGDGSVFSQVRAEWSAWASREPLGHVIAHALHNVADSIHVEFERVFEIWSCALGAVLVAVLVHADRETKSNGLLLAMALTTAAI